MKTLNISANTNIPYLKLSSSFPPKSGRSVGEIHNTWFCLIKCRAKKISEAYRAGSLAGMFPTGMWKYLAWSSCAWYIYKAW